VDFVDDQMASGRCFRILNIVDDVTRECLRGHPRHVDLGPAIVSDHGTELTSNAVFALVRRLPR
jgi:hypothetical protein